MTLKSKCKDEFEEVRHVESVEVETEIMPEEEEVITSPVESIEDEHMSREIVAAEDPPDGCIELRGEAVITEKTRLLEQYHRQHGSLVQNFSKGNVSAEDGVDLLILELLRESDALKGSELLFATRGNVRDETAVIIKRIEALETISKTIHRKQKMISEEVVNLDSPYIRILVQFITQKIHDCFNELGYEQEMIHIFFEKFQALTDNWKKEVKRDMIAFKDRQAMGGEDEDIETKK
jgi:hypothetical protein